MTTGTASGKSLGYLLPIVAATYSGRPPAGQWPGNGGPGWRQRPHTALYLAPTKALAHDQLRACTELGLDRWRIAAVDGDTPPDERDWARDYATFVLTNPDLLHRAVLPAHARWRGLLQALRYVVIDEAHRYHGVFGAQVAGVLRRLRRLAAHYGAASAVRAGQCDRDRRDTQRPPRCSGSPHTTSTSSTATARPAEQSRSACGSRTVRPRTRPPTCWRTWWPRAADHRLRAVAPVVRSGGPPRVGAARRIAARRPRPCRRCHRGLPRRLPGQRPAAPRSGPAERPVARHRRDERVGAGRRHRRRGRGGDLRLPRQPGGLVAAGRAGRATRRRRAGDPGGPTAAAGRVPAWSTPNCSSTPRSSPRCCIRTIRTCSDRSWPPPPRSCRSPRRIASSSGTRGWRWRPSSSTAGCCAHRPGGCYWTRPERAVDRVDLRSARGESIDIVELRPAAFSGTSTTSTADLVVHPGAVYLHLGESYLCEERDAELGERRGAGPAGAPRLRDPAAGARRPVDRCRAGQPRARLGSRSSRGGGGDLRVTGYLRRDEVTGQVWDATPLDLPERLTRTTRCGGHSRGMLGDESPTDLSEARLDAGVHAAEHVCLGLLPVFAPCDRWDIGATPTSGIRRPSRSRSSSTTARPAARDSSNARTRSPADGCRRRWTRVSRAPANSAARPASSSVCGSSRALDKATAAVLLRNLLG